MVERGDFGFLRRGLIFLLSCLVSIRVPRSSYEGSLFLANMIIQNMTFVMVKRFIAGRIATDACPACLHTNSHLNGGRADVCSQLRIKPSR